MPLTIGFSTPPAGYTRVENALLSARQLCVSSVAAIDAGTPITWFQMADRMAVLNGYESVATDVQGKAVVAAYAQTTYDDNGVARNFTTDFLAARQELRDLLNLMVTALNNKGALSSWNVTTRERSDLELTGGERTSLRAALVAFIAEIDVAP